MFKKARVLSRDTASRHKLYCNFPEQGQLTQAWMSICKCGGLGPWVRAKCGWRIVEFSVAFQTWILNYFVNGSRGWMMKCNVLTNFVAIFRKVITGAAQMDFFTTAAIVVVLQDFTGHFTPLALEFGVSHLIVTVTSSLSLSRIANYFDHRKCPRVLAGHVSFHIGSICGEILTLASDEMATQVDLFSVLILGSLVESEDFIGQLGVSQFQLRIWLGHEVTYFIILESWVLSDLVPWMLLVRVTRLHVPGQMMGEFGHVTTLTAHESATNVYRASPSVIFVKIEDALSCILVFLLELAERDDLE